MELFGFELKRKYQEAEDNKKISFVPKEDKDGSSAIAAGGHFGSYVDLDGTTAKSDADLILKYRQLAEQPECDAAIEDIVNESIVSDEDSSPVDIIMDDLEQPDKVKKLIKESFDEVTSLLNFNQTGHDTFRKWYVDGRLFYHIIVDEKNIKKGILELRPIDPTKIRKVREVKKDKRDMATGSALITSTDEYFIYQDQSMAKGGSGLKISKDAICYVTSGLLDSSRKRVLSYLQKAMKPINQLRMMEDSLVIYRLARAPERRIFYIDVGNLPRGKAEEYLRSVMSQYRNKLVYDANTGEIKDDRKHMSMLEDFWLPRREGGRGTEITSLPGGENLGQIDDVVFFQKKVYRSLNVPVGRLETEGGFSLGRSSEITRDELKFQKFINRLRKRFSNLFMELLKTQLILKGIINNDDWDELRDNINIDFLKDNHFSELKDSEMLRERLNTIQLMENYVGQYFSRAWVRRNVLRMSDEDVEQMEEEMEEEKEESPENVNISPGQDMSVQGEEEPPEEEVDLNQK
tara:strand:- start:637 stop:2193 length:1557 start_codon:yes stop_codon:yes gene_type:complete